MSDLVYLLHLAMGAIFAAAFFCVFILQRREAEADVQRLLDGLDAVVAAQIDAIGAVNEYVEFHAEQHHQLVTELASQMHEQIKTSERRLTTQVAVQGAHTDDTIQRVLTRPEARVAK